MDDTTIKLSQGGLTLRSLEPDDLPYFMRVENDPALWHVCDTRIPFSRFTLERILEAKVPDFFAERQLRLVVCRSADGQTVGFVDLFDFSPLHRRCAIGVVIYPADERNRGYGEQAVRLALDYAFNAFNLHQVWAEVGRENTPSVALFRRLGFVHSGTLRQWLLHGDRYEDVSLYQLSEDRFRNSAQNTDIPHDAQRQYEK